MRKAAGPPVMRNTADPDTLVADGPGAGLAFGGMLALASSMGIGRFVYTPILPAMAGALTLSKTEAGLIASANFVGYLAGSLLAAAPGLTGRRGTWFLAALAAGALATAAMGVAETMPAFLLLRFAGGIASAFGLVLGSAIVIDGLTRTGRAGWAPLHFAGVGLGIAASAALVDAVLAAGGDWRSLWLASGILAALAVPFCVWLIPSPPGHGGTGALPIVVAQSEKPAGLATLCLCHGLFGFGYVITATFLVAAIRGSPETRPLETVVWVAVGLAAMPSTLAWSRAGGRWGVLRAYAVACLIEAVGVAAGGVWLSTAGALLAAILLGGTFMGITALGFTAARMLGAAHQRRSFALMTAGFGAGQIAGPLVAGWMLDRFGGFAAPSLVAAAALVLAAAVAWWASSRLPQAA